MHKPFSFRTPVAIPEIGAEAGDFIRYRPDRPDVVYVVKRVPKATAMDVFTRLRTLARDLPESGTTVPAPVGHDRLQLVKGGDDG